MPPKTKIPLKPPTLSSWLRTDVGQQLLPYQPYTQAFHKLPLKGNVYLFLLRWVTPSLFVVPETRLTMTGVDLYTVKCASPYGVRVGFIFKTPWQSYSYRDHLLMHRSGASLSGLHTNRKYEIDDLQFYETDGGDGALISHTKPSHLADFLDK